MEIEKKLSILADAAKYDVSCASSGSGRRNTAKGLGNAAPAGVCHTYTEDGRCVSLLKILFTNICIYDCAYCINRRSNDVPRAAFTPAEVVRLTVDFYRRNYIEGLFLSSGVMVSPDDTMERMIRAVVDLRQEGFNGYVHLKCVPHTSQRLVQAAGRAADRLSVNIELPSDESLKRLTRKKTFASVLGPMGVIHESIRETRADRRRFKHVPAFAPAGQSTQLIVGASPESDHTILTLSHRLYRDQSLKRVYYSAFLPVAPAKNGLLPAIDAPPLQRENRLYQADWLLRLYGFSMEEIIRPDAPYLDLSMDPKQAFALRHPELFPVDINTADRELILRVPGIGLKSADRIVRLRRRGRIRFEHLKQMGVAIKRAIAFIHCDGLPTVHWQTGGQNGAASPQHLEPVNPLVYVTDGTFDGLLTAIFDAWQAAAPPHTVKSGCNGQQDLFAKPVAIVTDPAKSARVWRGLKTHLGAKARRRLADAFLSDEPDIAATIYALARQRIPGRAHIAGPADPAVQLTIDRLAKRVRQEAHRLKGFVRFSRTGEGRYLSLVAPKYDVLPLIRQHFENRFADRAWIIYDTSRGYGLGFDGRTTRVLHLDAGTLEHANDDDGERLCQTLWQQYYRAVNIPERDNPRLHRSLLPKRWWPYLTEKQGRS